MSNDEQPDFLSSPSVKASLDYIDQRLIDIEKTIAEGFKKATEELHEIGSSVDGLCLVIDKRLEEISEEK